MTITSEKGKRIRGHESASPDQSQVVGSRFNGSILHSLRAHGRRASPQDIHSRVLICVCRETTMLTGEDRLALAVRLVDGSAARTLLRGKGRIDGDKFAAPFFKFVGKNGGEGSPRLIEDASIEAALPAAFCRHVFNLEVFDHDRSEPASNVCADTMLPISADAGTARGNLSRPTNSAKLTPAPLFPSRNYALRGAVTVIQCVERRRQAHRLTSREHQGIRNSTVNADARKLVLRNGALDLASKADMPSEVITRNGDVQRTPFARSSVTKFNPTNLGDTNGTPLRVEFLRAGFNALEPETVVTALPKLGVTRTATKERHKSRVEIADYLAKAGRVNGGDPIVLRSELCDFCALRHPRNVAPVVLPKLSKPVYPLLQREVVNQAAYASELIELRFLFGGRRKSIAESATDHAGESSARRAA